MLTFIRSRWFPALLVLVAAIVGVLYVEHLRREAEAGKRAEAELRAQATDRALKAERLLAAERVNAAEMKRQAELAIERWGLAEEARRAQKAAPGAKPVAVLDLHTGPVVAGGSDASPTTPAGQEGAAGAPSAGRGTTSQPEAPPCMVYRGERLDLGTGGPVMRAPGGSEAYVLKLRALNLDRVVRPGEKPERQHLVAEGDVNPDLSKVQRSSDDMLPPPDPTGWIVGLGVSVVGPRTFAGHVDTPPLRLPRWVPLAGGRALRAWATPEVTSTADGLEWRAVFGGAIELGGRR